MFGDLRAHVREALDWTNPELQHTRMWRAEVRTLIESAAILHPASWHEQGVPYLASFPSLWKTPLIHVNDSDHAELWRHRAPFASVVHYPSVALVNQHLNGVLHLDTNRQHSSILSSTFDASWNPDPEGFDYESVDIPQEWLRTILFPLHRVCFERDEATTYLESDSPDGVTLAHFVEQLSEIELKLRNDQYGGSCIETRYIYFEGLYVSDDGVWDVHWGS